MKTCCGPTIAKTRLCQVFQLSIISLYANSAIFQHHLTITVYSLSAPGYFKRINNAIRSTAERRLISCPLFTSHNVKITGQDKPGPEVSSQSDVILYRWTNNAYVTKHYQLNCSDCLLSLLNTGSIIRDGSYRALGYSLIKYTRSLTHTHSICTVLGVRRCYLLNYIFKWRESSSAV